MRSCELQLYIHLTGLQLKQRDDVVNNDDVVVVDVVVDVGTINECVF